MPREVLALVPARAGSKEVPQKNIASLGGKPLIAYTIEQALAARFVTRTVVSTDSAYYAEIAKEWGAETPFLRPAEISGDLSTDLEAFSHALEWLATNEDYNPEICVHLRPTCPIRQPGEIDRAIALLVSDPSFDSVRSVVPAKHSPHKAWFVDPPDTLVPAVSSELRDPYNLPRQALPPAFVQNASIDVVWTRVIREKRSMTGDRIRAFFMDEMHDIDSFDDLEGAGSAIVEPDVAGRRFVIDIDGIIAALVPGNDYQQAMPLHRNIALVNELFEKGAEVVLFTARGSVTGIDWVESTQEQLQNWGVKYHQLVHGKPAADFYVDDRALSLGGLRRLLKGT